MNWDYPFAKGQKLLLKLTQRERRRKKRRFQSACLFLFKIYGFRYFACWAVHSLKVKIKINRTFDGTYFAVLIACCSFCFHNWATSLANGSSGFGAERSAWIDKRTVRICKAGDHLSFRISCRGIKSKFNEKGTLAG